MKPVNYAPEILLEEFIRYVKEYEKSPRINFAIHAGRPGYFPVSSRKKKPDDDPLDSFALIDLAGTSHGELIIRFEDTIKSLKNGCSKTIETEQFLPFINSKVGIFQETEEDKLSLISTSKIEFYIDRADIGKEALTWLGKLLAIYQQKLVTH